MKKKVIQDERITSKRRKIQSDAFGILFFVLLVSVVIQQQFLKAPFEQYAVEIICFFGMSVYIIIGNIIAGDNMFGEGKRAKIIPLIHSLIAGITVTVINGILNYSRYAGHYEDDNTGYFIGMLAVTFISSAGASFIVLYIFYIVNKKRQEKIEKHLDTDE